MTHWMRKSGGDNVKRLPPQLLVKTMTALLKVVAVILFLLFGAYAAVILNEESEGQFLSPHGRVTD